MTYTTHATRTRASLALAIAVATIALIVPSRALAANPVEAKFAAAGPYATATGVVDNSEGKPAYDLYYPASYSSLGFKSPIVTWGNGTDALPSMYSTLLTHLASYGFTVIASTLENTGSGREIAQGAKYLVEQNVVAGSVFDGNLNTSEVAAVGHSQGAGGATNAALENPTLIKTLMTFSLPNTEWVGTNADCKTKEECMYHPEKLTQPVFFISTHGLLDSIIASPATELAFFKSVKVQAAVGIIKTSEGKTADHNSIQNVANGGNPGGELGYATAWLEYQLLGNATAAEAFTGKSPELVANTAWPESKVQL